MRKYIIILFLLWSNILFGNDTISFHKADSLLRSGDYQAAMVAYERVIFNAGDERMKASAILEKAYAQKAYGHYEAASNSLFRIVISPAWDDVFKYKILYEKSLCYYLLGEYVKAENMLMKMTYSLSDSNILQKSLFLKILVLNELGDWRSAKDAFAKYLDINDLSLSYLSWYDQILDEKHYKSEKKAKTLSFILPGMGQMYAGSIGRGLSSLVLNGSFGAYTYLSFANGYYYTALFTGTTFLMRLYLGGVQYAQQMVSDRNAEYQNKIKNEIKDFIIKEKNKY